ncbi:DUF6492 family protein [Treponema zioleckii]|uniref:DUF6492 family protein n=1 Tax=Treponema zioleckii TaxID=331680 RepID=UPI00168C062C|nr:DUF6492 family protein [Treponema zioleckii]
MKNTISLNRVGLQFNLYLILDWQTWASAKKSIPYLKKNINSKNIVIVSSPKILGEDLLGCDFLDENTVVEGLSFDSVREYIEKLGGTPKNTGWYLQQFIKLGLCRNCQNDYYLVWDADTIPLNKIEFFDKSGKPFFNLKREYFYSYFRTIENLFAIKKSTKESFISEHMIFNSEICRNMLNRIESNDKFEGENFWQKILCASELLKPDFIKKDQRFFSEFETFGTFCDHFYPNFYAKRKLRTLRHGTDFLGKNPTDEVLEWAAKDFDTVSFEEWGMPIPEMILMIENPVHRTKISFANTIRLFFKKERRKIFEKFPKINHEQFKNFFEKTIAKTNFDFFFGKKLAYGQKFHWGERSLFWRIRPLYVTKCRIQRYWRLLTFKF